MTIIDSESQSLLAQTNSMKAWLDLPGGASSFSVVGTWQDIAGKEIRQEKDTQKVHYPDKDPNQHKQIILSLHLS